MPSPDPQVLLAFALDAAQLKRTPRTGWQLRGAPLGGVAENVAAHSFGVAFLTMLLLDYESVADPAHALRLALVHDLAESRLGDLPATIRRYLPPATKQQAEQAAMTDIATALPHGADYVALWQEYADAQSDSARLVKDADRLDMLLQAYLYEQAGQRNLDDFWQNEAHAYYTTTANQIANALVALRTALHSSRT